MSRCATFGDGFRARFAEHRKWFPADYAGTTVWPANPRFNGPNDVILSLDRRMAVGLDHRSAAAGEPLWICAHLRNPNLIPPARSPLERAELRFRTRMRWRSGSVGKNRLFEFRRQIRVSRRIACGAHARNFRRRFPGVDMEPVQKARHDECRGKGPRHHGVAR